MKFKSRSKICRRAACIGLTVMMGATFAASQVFASNGGQSPVKTAQAAAEAQSSSLEFENVNGKVDLTDIKLNNLSSKVIECTDEDYSTMTRTAIIALDSEPLTERLGAYNSDNLLTDEGRIIAESIEKEQDELLAEIDRAGIRYTLKSRYNTVLNAVAIEVNLGQLRAIKNLKGVSTVSVSSTYSLPKTADGDGAQYNYSSIRETGIYDSLKDVPGYTGEGMTVAILDTGIDYTHEAFSKDPANPRFDEEYVKNAMAGGTFRATARSGATYSDVYVSSKIPFAYDYSDSDADVYPSYSQHGVHVAGIVAGQADSYTDKDGHIATDADGNEIPFRGVAPEAQLVICKVFTDNLDDPELGGAETVDILDALEDCVNLNVDVINMSLGTSAGFSSASLGLTEDDDEGKLLDATYSRVRAQGISLITAASNDYSAGYGSAYGTNLATNPDSGTVGSPSTFSGALSVASINGQLSPYLLINETPADWDGTSVVTGGEAIYYEESRNEDSDAYNFLNDMLGGEDPTKEGYKTSATYRYVMIPSTGAPTDYTKTITDTINEANAKGEKVIAVVQRGVSSFKDKIDTAKKKGAAAIIVYNNVSGMVRMSLEDLEERIPAISVSIDAGALLKNKAGRSGVGTITLDRSYAAGPFMNDYSSWGSTPDLKLKPDVTAHGGEITSAVAGGYDEMSGTSMACPNLAGFTALLRSKLKNEYPSLWKKTNDAKIDNLELTKLTNNIVMSTATTVYDQNKLPYSPRKQGAGLATLKNAFGTSAYLYTKEADGMCEDGRPKAELGDDPDKKGVYNIVFYVNNFGSEALTFTPNAIVMTETLSADKKSVAEKANKLKPKTVAWTVNGQPLAEGASITAATGETKIEVKIELSSADKRELEKFPNGMFVEGFLQLEAKNEGAADQCNLNLPFMGFYGDWKKAPMLDYDCFEIAEFDKDTSLKEENRPKPNVWATQAYSYYFNDKYATPLGSFLYVQDEDLEHTSKYVYTDEEHIAISRFNEYNGATALNNYMTITGIKALYAGLLRNAEVVTYTLTNEDTGEIVPDDNGITVREIYRVNKAYAGGGNAVPALALLELKTDDLGLAANGKYRLDFSFYFDYDDKDKPTDDTFSMSFYIDYEAPILVDSRIRYQDRKNGNKDVQQVFLDLDIYDNTYPQAVILCYSETGDATDTTSLKLVTEYITPIINPKKNTTNTVSIDITDFYEDYKGKLYLEIDDYALNHNVYMVDLTHSQTANAAKGFSIAEGDEITIAKNTAYKLGIESGTDTNPSNYVWRTSGNTDVVKVKDGEIFGVAEGVSYVSATGADGYTDIIRVAVTAGGDKIIGSDGKEVNPSMAFGTIINADDAPVRPNKIVPDENGSTNRVEVNPAQEFQLTLSADPWYYPLDGYKITYKSDDPTAVSVDENGYVKVLFEDPEKTKSVVITATATKGESTLKTTVTLLVRQPYTVMNGTLTAYHGWGGEEVNGVRVLKIPSDKSIMMIGEEAFRDNEHVQVVIIPKAVTQIGERAFRDCKNLKKICFISEEAITPADSSLNLIHRDAFMGCEKLETVDLSNCKVITLDKDVFTGCTSLREVVKATAIGTAYDRAFKDCTSLASFDLSALHTSGASLFAGCTSLASITVSENTAMGAHMFEGCTSLTNVTLSNPVIPDYAFNRCTGLQTVTLAGDVSSIGAYAFASCSKMTAFNTAKTGGGDYSVGRIGDYAFRNCSDLAENAILYNAELGRDVFAYANKIGGSAQISGNKLVLAPKQVTSSTVGATEIGAYAYSGSYLSGVNTLDISAVTKIGEGAFSGLAGLESIIIPEGVTEIPDYAFRGTGLKSINIPASVNKIGKGAFADCESLATVTFNGTALTEIGEEAFKGTAITSVALPSGVTKLGGRAFAECLKLKTAAISAVTEMGVGAFMTCPALEEASFAAGATTTGEYTFWALDFNTGRQTASALKTVELADTITEIGAGAFAYCTSLESIDLKNATKVMPEAFYGCTSLQAVTGLNKVTSIGVPAETTLSVAAGNSFAGCASLTEADLSAAQDIAYNSFFGCTRLRTVTFGNALKTIGSEAFAETALTSVTIPASCTYVGTSAFSGAESLAAFTVASGNKSYVAKDGVLYRYIDKEKGVLELAAYPVGKGAKRDNGVLTYTVEEGTVNIQPFAFYGVSKDMVVKVILPHTLKTIGNGAFFNSGITVYEFRSIAAPSLLQGISEKIVTDDYSTYSFFYNNFVGYLADCAPHSPSGQVGTLSTLTIMYPANGTGYDNFVYTYYFGTKNVTEELPEDSTRELIKLIDSFDSAEEVANYAQTKDEAFVTDFSAQVTEAHRLYNGISSNQAQIALANKDGERVAKLFAIEANLRPVKQHFGIAFSVDSVEEDASSSHRSEYRPGERFDMSGLKVCITYSDLSQEVIDATEGFKLSSSYDRELRDYDEMVTLEGYGDYEGQMLSVLVNVSEKTATAEPETQTGGEGGEEKQGLSTPKIVAIVLGCVAAVAIAVAVTLVVLGKKGVIKLGKKGVKGGAEVSADEDGQTVEDAEEEDKEQTTEATEEGKTDD